MELLLKEGEKEKEGGKGTATAEQLIMGLIASLSKRFRAALSHKVWLAYPHQSGCEKIIQLSDMPAIPPSHHSNTDKKRIFMSLASVLW